MGKHMTYLGKDIVNTLTKTNFPSGAPDFDESGIQEIFTLSGVTVQATQAQTVDAYNATDWADATKPNTAHHIMLGVNAGIRTWKMKDALAAGDMLIALVRDKLDIVKTS